MLIRLKVYTNLNLTVPSRAVPISAVVIQNHKHAFSFQKDFDSILQFASTVRMMTSKAGLRVILGQGYQLSLSLSLSLSHSLTQSFSFLPVYLYLS